MEKLTYEEVLAMDLPNIIVYAVPAMIAFTLLEWGISQYKHRKTYDNKDTLVAIAIGAVNLWNIPSPSPDGTHIFVLPGKSNGMIHIIMYFGESMEIAVNNLSGLFRRKAEPGSQAILRYSVNNSEIDFLGFSAMILVDHLQRNIKNRCSGGRMDVLTSGEGFLQSLIA